MTKLLVLNPNTSIAMTQRVVAQVELLVSADRRQGPGVQVRGVTAASGPPVIASREAYALGATAGLALAREHAGWADVILLACFGDPGLDALRAETRVPVVGMAESALLEARALGLRARILTMGEAWVEMLHEVALARSLESSLESVVALPGTGLDVARDPGAFLTLVQHALDAAQGEGVQFAVLGGAGFAGMRPGLRFEGALIDGLEAAVRAALAVA